jgi:hypothetical protein
MSTDESIKYLKTYAENFVDSVRKKKGITLDYTVHSLIAASTVALDYGEIYKRVTELKDPRAEEFFVEAVYQLTGYFGEVYCRQFGASWIIKDDPDDVLIQVGEMQFPLYSDACESVRLGNGALTLRFPKIKEASKDFLLRQE